MSSTDMTVKNSQFFEDTATERTLKQLRERCVRLRRVQTPYVTPHVSRLVELSAAELALVFAFARVFGPMDGKTRLLVEGCAAELADKRLFAGMYAIVTNELTILFERFATSIAFVVEIASIDPLLVCLVLQRGVYLQVKSLMVFQ